MTLVQKFYEIAKTEANAKALQIAVDDEYHNLPWWYYKSKVKHFALGLIERKAGLDQIAYLFCNNHANSFFAHLSFLSLGLQVITLTQQNANLRSELFEKYPPNFIYVADHFENMQEEFGKLKSIKSIIVEEEHLKPSYKSSETFREIFNDGIYHESEHFKKFDNLRKNISETNIVSPIQITLDGELIHTPLRHSDVLYWCQNLSHELNLSSNDRLFFASSLGNTWQQVFSIYWPILSGVKLILPAANIGLAKNLRLTKPSILWLDLPAYEAFSEIISVNRFNWLKKYLLRWRIGFRVHSLLHVDDINFTVPFIDQLKIRSISLQKLLEKNSPAKHPC